MSNRAPVLPALLTAIRAEMFQVIVRLAVRDTKFSLTILVRFLAALINIVLKTKAALTVLQTVINAAQPDVQLVQPVMSSLLTKPASQSAPLHSIVAPTEPALTVQQTVTNVLRMVVPCVKPVSNYFGAVHVKLHALLSNSALLIKHASTVQRTVISVIPSDAQSVRPVTNSIKTTLHANQFATLISIVPKTSLVQTVEQTAIYAVHLLVLFARMASKSLLTMPKYVNRNAHRHRPVSPTDHVKTAQQIVKDAAQQAALHVLRALKSSQIKHV